jgi:hypothetical protein
MSVPKQAAENTISEGTGFTGCGKTHLSEGYGL